MIRLTGKDAAEIGLALKSYPATELETEVMRLADRMGLVDPHLLSANKRLVNLGLELMGARTLQRIGAEIDARGHLAPESDGVQGDDARARGEARLPAAGCRVRKRVCRGSGTRSGLIGCPARPAVADPPDLPTEPNRRELTWLGRSSKRIDKTPVNQTDRMSPLTK